MYKATVVSCVLLFSYSATFTRYCALYSPGEVLPCNIRQFGNLEKVTSLKLTVDLRVFCSTAHPVHPRNLIHYYTLKYNFKSVINRGVLEVLGRDKEDGLLRRRQGSQNK